MNITIDKFKGTAPKIEPRLLSSDYAQVSTNIRYDSGAMLPIKKFNNIAVAPTDIDVYSVYKYKLTPTTDKWLYFDTNITLAKDPLYNNADNRIIISGMEAPRIFDNAIATTNNTLTADNTYLLGIPVPATPTMAVTAAGTSAFESRAYVVQYDRVWSDEKIDQGPLSAPAVTAGGLYYVDCTSNGTVTISGIADAPSGCGITHITISRSGTTHQDSAFHFVRTFSISAAKAGSVPGVTWNSGSSTFTVADSALAADLGPACINQDYIGPDVNMKGIIQISSGMLAGFCDNYVCFSEPYQCHAWPDHYKVAIDSPVVGIGYFGDMVVVCTNAEPYIIHITDPANAIAFPIKEFAPCISAEGIVSYRDAVVYPSEAGFIRIDRLGVANLTQSIADIHDMKDFDMNIVRATGLGSYYYVLYITSAGQTKMLTLNMQDPSLGFGACDKNIRCMYADFESASLYCVYKNELNIQYLGEYDSGTGYEHAVWRSKIFSLSEDTVNFSAARVRSELSEINTGGIDYSTLKFGINCCGYNVKPVNGISSGSISDGLTFMLFVDGSLVFSKNISNSKPFRLPAGYIGKDVEIMIVGNAPVYRVDLASSITELAE